MALTKTEIDTYRKFFGAPPVLSSENPQHFEELFDGIVDAIQPEDIIVFMQLRHYICAQWLINRYVRHSTVAIESRHLQVQSVLDGQAKLREQKKLEQAELNAEKDLMTPPDVAAAVSVERRVTDVCDAVEDVLTRPANDIAHNRAMQQNMVFIESLSRLIVTETARSNESLRQIELYRSGLGQVVEKVTKEVLDAEVTEVAAIPSPALVPQSEENGHDLAPADRSEPKQ